MSHRREVDNILSATPKPLKQSQGEPEPSDVNDTFLLFFPHPHLYSYFLTACPLQLMPSLFIPLYVLAYPRAEFIPFG